MKTHKEFMDKLIELAHEPTLPEKTKERFECQGENRMKIPDKYI